MNTSYRLKMIMVSALLSIMTMAGPAWGSQVIYVHAGATGAGDGSSWADAYTAVQPALNAAQPGDQVWVAAGTYVERPTLTEGVALYGGFGGDENPATFDLADRDFAVNETILDGNQGGSVVTAPSGATETTRIDGFTIRNGHGEYGGGISLTDSSPTIANNVITGNTSGGIGVYPDYDVRRGSGGGVNSSGGDPVIIGNLVVDNQAVGYEREASHEECVEWDPETGECIRWEWWPEQMHENGYGGGVYCYSYGSSTIANNTIASNSAFDGYGGGIHAAGSLTIANNRITGNSASNNGYGGGIHASGSPAIANNTITSNSASIGGGIDTGYGSPTIANNTITSNSALNSGGGIYSSSGSPTIANNTITSNSASTGGGILTGYGSPTIANNTIASNSALNSGGGIYIYGSPTIANTIVAFNSSGIYGSGGTPVLRHNCVYGNTAFNYSGVTDPTGTDGNISADPLFVRTPDPGPDSVWGTADDDPGDVHLLADSPCVDAGDNAYAIGDYDLDGNPRVVDGDVDDVAVVDMGAYEYSLAIEAADFDADGDVDLADFAQFTRCFNGPENPPAPGCEVDADLDNDDDVDADDFVIFEQSLAASGPSA